MKLDSSNPPVYLPQSEQTSILRLGFENCAMEDWIHAANDLALFHRHKAALRESIGERCYAEMPGSEPAQDEFHDFLLEHLIRQTGLGYRRVGKRLVHERENLSWDIANGRLWAASTWVPEDICLLEPRDGNYLMTAASVCSPSNWILTEKIGQSIDSIHAPVPAYRKVLSERVNRFLHGLPQGRVLLRYNWSIQPGNELYWQADPAQGQEAENAPAPPAFWRIERQTFLRLPSSGAIVFGIRIFLHSFTSLQRSGDFDRTIAQLIAQLPDEQRQYKGIADLTMQ